MTKTDRPSSALKSRTYRKRIRDAGEKEVLFKLPEVWIELIDEIQESQGLRNRSQALLQLIERGREATQQIA
jgi:hypothetical protein